MLRLWNRLAAVWLLLLAAGLAQAALTPVFGIIQRADGTFPSGYLNLSWQGFTNAVGVRIPAGNIRNLPIVNGVVSVSLEPNVGATPAGTSYAATYTLNGSAVAQYRWYVPVSATQVALSLVEFPPVGLQGPSAIIALSQLLQGGATLNQALCWSGANWAPGSCGGSGGGSSLFSAILASTNNSGQILTVGSTSSLTYSGTGAINANRILGIPIASLYGSTGQLVAGSGTFTNGNLRSSDINFNSVDSGVPVASLANAASLTSGILAAGRLPAINLAVAGAGGGVVGNLPVANLAGGVGANAGTCWAGDASWRSCSGSGTVGAPYTASFTSTTHLTVTSATHGFLTKGLIVLVYDTATPAQLLVPDHVTVDASTFQVDVYFTAAQAGVVVINGGAGPAGAAGVAGAAGAVGATGPAGGVTSIFGLTGVVGNLSGDATTSGSLVVAVAKVAGVPASAVLIRPCESTAGDPDATSPALINGNDSLWVCGNKTGATLTITAVECTVDAGTLTITPVFTGGGAILTGPLTCGTAGTFLAGTLSGTPTQAPGVTIDADITVAGGTARYLVIRITRTL